MRSVVPKEERPFRCCDDWVLGNVAMCWAPSDAWEMTQAQVCSLCEIHNRSRGIEPAVAVVKKTPDMRFVTKGSKLCIECGNESYKGRVLCYRCILETRRKKPYKPRTVKAAAMSA